MAIGAYQSRLRRSRSSRASLRFTTSKSARARSYSDSAGVAGAAGELNASGGPLIGS